MPEHKVEKRHLDLKGQVFGRLTVSSLYGKDRTGKYLWLCRCECGVEKKIRTSSLRRGAIVSCGCYSREMAAKHRRKHGHYANYSRTPTYDSWASMLGRCRNPQDAAYRHYGGRGISVCERWLAFVGFLEDMGDKPSSKYTLERVDNNGNYEPGNCIWATRTQQARNRRSTHFEAYNGETRSLVEWSELFLIPYDTLKRRFALGWSAERALTEPVRKCRVMAPTL